MNDPPHGPDKDARHDQVTSELQLHFREQDPQEAQVEAFAVHQSFERADVLDPIGAIQDLCDLIEGELEHGFDPVGIGVLRHAELHLEPLRVHC